eukprot:scaffold11248_cov60-Cylindrotheca_fusiformis.AAC.3
MGCTSSKEEESSFRRVNDSVHAKIRLDQKRYMEKGEPPKGYKPRPVHPVLLRAESSSSATTTHDDNNNNYYYDNNNKIYNSAKDNPCPASEVPITTTSILKQ